MTDMESTKATLVAQGKKLAGGSVKSMVIAAYTVACINATPKLVGLIAVMYPKTYDFLGEGCIFQFVVLVESLGASFIYWVNWKNLVDAATDAVKALYAARKQIRDAAKEQP